MKECKYCGKEFDVTYARRLLGRRYGAGAYNDEYPDADVCENCATEYIGGAYATGLEIQGWLDRENDE